MNSKTSVKVPQKTLTANAKDAFSHPSPFFDFNYVKKIIDLLDSKNLIDRHLVIKNYLESTINSSIADIRTFKKLFLPEEERYSLSGSQKPSEKVIKEDRCKADEINKCFQKMIDNHSEDNIKEKIKKECGSVNIFNSDCFNKVFECFKNYFTPDNWLKDFVFEVINEYSLASSSDKKNEKKSPKASQKNPEAKSNDDTQDSESKFIFGYPSSEHHVKIMRKAVQKIKTQNEIIINYSDNKTFFRVNGHDYFSIERKNLSTLKSDLSFSASLPKKSGKIIVFALYDFFAEHDLQFPAKDSGNATTPVISIADLENALIYNLSIPKLDNNIEDIKKSADRSKLIYYLFNVTKCVDHQKTTFEPSDELKSWNISITPNAQAEDELYQKALRIVEELSDFPMFS